MRLEVRCCCQPQLLLGWLDMPSNVEVREGAQVVFHARAKWQVSVLTDPPCTITPAARVVLTVSLFSDPAHNSLPHFALKSEETPLEVLRRIDRFIENRDGST